MAPPGVPGINSDEAKRLAEARKKAEEDPTVKSLKEARKNLDQQLESAMNAAMVAADPSVAQTVEKVKESRERAKGMRERFDSLTSDQRQQLKTARESAMKDPSVAAAREKMKTAEGPEAKRAAGREVHEAIKAAMLKENPDLAPVLDSLGQRERGMRGPRPGGGPGGPPPPPPGDE